MSGRPKMCASCGKLMGVVTTCPYCGADNTRLSVKLGAMAKRGGGEGLFTTVALITINLFLYATALAVGGVGAGGVFDFLTPDYEVLFRIGIQDNAAIDAGQWWRLFLMVFLHLGVMHVAFNCYVLYYAGRILEGDIGARLFFLVYMVAGLAGSVGSYFAGIGGAGASGAVFGLLGAVLARRRIQDGHLRHPISKQILFLLGINAVFAFMMGGHINHVAHVGGFVAGAACMAGLTSFRLGRVGAVTVMLGTWALGLATFAAFALMVISLLHGGPSDLADNHRCWQRIDRMLGAGFDPAAAEAAAECAGAMSDLEPAANVARDAAHRGLTLALAAFDRGDSARLDEGLAAAAAARDAFVVWEREALPRYGMPFISGP